MPSKKISTVAEPAETRALSEYFYDMLDQLLIIGQQAGGDALIDATLIGGLLASQKAERAARKLDVRHSA